MSQSESAFCAGSSALRRRRMPLPKADPDDPRTLAANELREASTHSRRALTLIANCWQDYEGGECNWEEVMCLLAAVDDAARAVRGMLTQMGHSDYVERWEETSAKFDQAPRPRGRPTTRGASRPKGKTR